MATMAGFLSPETPPSSRYTKTNSNLTCSSYGSDQPVASSPLMGQDSFTPRDRFADSASSHKTSARLSRELASWRTSLALSSVGTEFEDDDDDDGFDDRTERSHANGTVRPELGRDNIEATPGVDETDTFLSQQLEDAMRSAKDRLSRLEGKVKGARHSLADLPALASYSPTSPASSPSKATFSNVPSRESSNRLNRSPRINFGIPRTGSTRSSPKERTGQRHARNFSDTSIPSPFGQVTKGSLAPEASPAPKASPPQPTPTPTPRPDLSGRLSVRDAPFRTSRPLSSLDPVLEEASSPQKESHDPLEESNKRSSQLLGLRDDAKLVRNRLSFVQEGVRSAVEKRRSWKDGTSAILPEEVAHIKEVHALGRMLDRQEDEIGQLEQGDVPEQLPANGDDRWEEERRATSYSERDFQELPNEDDVESDVDPEHRSVLDEAELNEMEPDFEESHENRADAFDYEHFIIHSVLNTAKLHRPRSERSSSSASSTSVSTPRGPSGEVEDDTGNSSTARDMDSLEQSNQSVASFATAHSFMNTSDSESDAEEQTSDDERELLDNEAAWPTPPATNSNPTSGRGSVQHSTRNSKQVIGNGLTNEAAPRVVGGRPASMVYSAVIDQASGSSNMSEDDETLIRSLAESMRHACKELQRSAVDPTRADDWRYRLEEARRLLSGESEIF